ncbi:MAG: hypothetical protein EAZ74_04610 [Alphaproteobacteria bacterium]|nr:MAG: hypothetical protein EAY76_03440 [Alphaproteobacteria bacterium]TAF14122.1 MAG: hypothetical protein EAZ74_04610 [Alphaproteobacteria bacterium]TAF75194.1 MAG: hypothetical protein EAZ52_07255 [Alphaproteobacteria bacterium]
MPSRKRAPRQEESIAYPPCDKEGCLELGLYKAPKYRDGRREYYHFCLEHIREFNKNYNFFEGMDDDAMQRFMHESVIGHRPTWRIGDQPKLSELELESRLRHFFSDSPSSRSAPSMPTLPERIQRALTSFTLEHPVTPKEIKQRYKKLVKQYHPDINKAKHATENFLIITESYQCLIEYYENF